MTDKKVPTEIRKALGVKLRKARKAKKLKQIYVAQVLGVHRIKILRLENGETDLKAAEIILFSILYDCDPIEFITPAW